MVELTLVRHGQAQTGARDEASYDSLSNLGHQARWLGEVLRQEHPYDLGFRDLPLQIDPRQRTGLFWLARWLGEVLRQEHPYDQIISGAMTRQMETAQSLGFRDLPLQIDPRLNELDYFGA